jgi:hypothetical protein
LIPTLASIVEPVLRRMRNQRGFEPQ